MTIRIKQWKDDKNEFEVIKWTYDKEQGRSIPKKVGKNFRITWSGIPADILKELSEDEKKDLKAFWKETTLGRENEELARLSVVAEYFSTQLKKAIERNLLNSEEIEKIGKALDDAKKQISSLKRKVRIGDKKEKKEGK